MLVARDKSGHLVNLLDQEPVGREFTCPACGGAVRLKRGTIMRPYFAHISLKNCHFYSENESAEHLSLKAKLYQALSQTEDVCVEQVLPALSQIADLLVNQDLALEVQCSRLPQARLLERSRSYRQHGFQVLWLLGKKLWLGHRLSPLHRDFLYFSENMGFHLWELDLDRSCVRLKYLIYEDWRGHLHYLEKEHPFSKGLLDFFRLPYRAQTLSFYKVKMDQHLLTYIQSQLLAKNKTWLKRQETAYQQGKNLLAYGLAAYFPQIRPLQGEFGQIDKDLTNFRANFMAYYRQQSQQIFQLLYPPKFYDKIRQIPYRK